MNILNLTPADEEPQESSLPWSARPREAVLRNQEFQSTINFFYCIMGGWSSRQVNLEAHTVQTPPSRWGCLYTNSNHNEVRS